jgi:hypothetical protein
VQGGTQTCNVDGNGFGPCEGEVLPADELCANAIDDDCNGTVDDDPDADGDGFTVCGGDCCDAPAQLLEPRAGQPRRVRGPGNLVDDDCDGDGRQPAAAVRRRARQQLGRPLDYAKAIDLCQVDDRGRTARGA